MYNVENIGFDTPIEIKCLNPGIYIPECKSYTPIRTLCSVSDIISILNRGIDLEFPQQETNEISMKIEELILYYDERKKEIQEKYNTIKGTDVTTALETIQEINDSKTPEEIIEENSHKLFDYTDIAKQTVENLTRPSLKHVFDSDDYNTDYSIREERMRKEELIRKKISEVRKEASAMNEAEMTLLRNLAQDAKYDSSMEFADIDDIDIPSKNTKKK